jgi:hypothetical protein
LRISEIATSSSAATSAAASNVVLTLAMRKARERKIPPCAVSAPVTRPRETADLRPIWQWVSGRASEKPTLTGSQSRGHANEQRRVRAREQACAPTAPAEHAC